MIIVYITFTITCVLINFGLGQAPLNVFIFSYLNKRTYFYMCNILYGFVILISFGIVFYQLNYIFEQ